PARSHDFTTTSRSSTPPHSITVTGAEPVRRPLRNHPPRSGFLRAANLEPRASVARPAVIGVRPRSPYPPPSLRDPSSLAAAAPRRRPPRSLLSRAPTVLFIGRPPESRRPPSTERTTSPLRCSITVLFFVHTPG
uniref:Uncharacterized protein n=1 Tax=Aegilops tauschii subsp. strangulata TaxID=200361 RepID=A0A453GD20_AEGTS